MAHRISILDDYQNAALGAADWAPLAAEYTIDVVREHIGDADRLVARLDGSRVIVAMRERTAFPREVLERLPSLRLLISTGMKNPGIDLAAAAELGITVSGTEGSWGTVTELVFGMMISLGRHLVDEDAAVHAGGWQHTLGRGLAGSTLGILGLGRLGGEVAAIAPAFGMDVIAWSPHLTQERADEHGARAVGERELYSASDFLTIHLPLARGTRGLVGREQLGWMSPRSYLINTSRGPIVDEAALIEALRADRIAGAGLDVFDLEPLPVEHPLRSLPNALLTPHLGYVTEQTYEVFYSQAVEDILGFDAGEPLRLLG
ncbi:MAG TPA: D-2-hydroxyacid dehydrogenase family protein [Galbitalea sp.]|jgi:phosphoglycerate dehydrogenase-like enzyme